VVGQLALHRKVEILDKSKVPLIRLLRTLIERPDLAQQVQALKLHVHKEKDWADIGTSRQFSIGQLIG
jgi:hypothetical protein